MAKQIKLITLKVAGQSAMATIRKRVESLSSGDKDEARNQIISSPISLEVRCGWTAFGDPLKAEEYAMLLVRGGPVDVRIVGEIEGGKAATAKLQVQNIEIPWTDFAIDDGDPEILLTYAHQFCME